MRVFGWVQKNIKFLQASAAVFAMAAAINNFGPGVWRWINQDILPLDPAITFHEITVHNSYVGGRIFISSVLTKMHPECHGSMIQYVVRDNRGVTYDLPQQRPGVASKKPLINIPWANDWALPDGVSSGQAYLYGAHSLETEGKPQCDQIVVIPLLPFWVYTAEEAAAKGDVTKEIGTKFIGPLHSVWDE